MCVDVKYGIWNVAQPEAGSVNALVAAGYAPLAAMVLASLPMIIAYPFAQKYFVQGVLLGSVKG